MSDLDLQKSVQTLGASIDMFSQSAALLALVATELQQASGLTLPAGQVDAARWIAARLDLLDATWANARDALNRALGQQAADRLCEGRTPSTRA